MSNKIAFDALWDESPIDVTPEVNFIWSILLQALFTIRKASAPQPKKTALFTSASSVL